MQPLTERQKKYLRTVRGTKLRWSKDQTVGSSKPKEREFLAPVREGFTPCKVRGRSGTRLSDAMRAKIAARQEARREFFAEIGITIP